MNKQTQFHSWFKLFSIHKCSLSPLFIPLLFVVIQFVVSFKVVQTQILYPIKLLFSLLLTKHVVAVSVAASCFVFALKVAHCYPCLKYWYVVLLRFDSALIVAAVATLARFVDVGLELLDVGDVLKSLSWNEPVKSLLFPAVSCSARLADLGFSHGAAMSLVNFEFIKSTSVGFNVFEQQYCCWSEQQRVQCC